MSPARIAVVGVSVGRTCGVRDHATLLADALRGEGIDCSEHWLWRRGGSLRAARSEVRPWARELAAELGRSRPDAIVFHYSVFSYSYRGLPVFVRPVLSALRGSEIPVITVLHELVYPWGRGGWRGKVWAVTQRLLLVGVVRTSAALIVTVDFRAEWLASRLWLPRRTMAIAPVFSNLPPSAASFRPQGAAQRIGLFGYPDEGPAIPLVLDALRLLSNRGLDVELQLLGAPGGESPVGERWREAARARALDQALSFSGRLPAQDLSDALAACDVLLLADTTGPSSRKGTLAGSLASGRPLVAIDGRRRWQELVLSQAAQVVAPTSQALADAIGALLADGDLREAQGARGRAFYEREMDIARTTEAVNELLASILDHGLS